MFNKFKIIIYQSPNRYSVNQADTYYMTHKAKVKDTTIQKYHKYREIEKATMCPDPDPTIYLPHWKYVCCRCQKCLLLFLTNKDTIQSSFMSYIK